MKRGLDVLVALASGAVCHTGFVLAIGLMAVGLADGMQSGAGAVPGAAAVWADFLLAAQFPLLHSALLTTRGRRILARLMPGRRGGTLAPTTFVIVTAVQLLAVFGLWTPTGVVWWQPSGVAGVAAWAAFVASWLFLIRAIFDAGAGLQTGVTGWWAVLRDRRPDYGGLPVRGLFRFCRQPIYLGFLLVLMTAPTRSPDVALLTAIWGPYCILAPRLKERRFLSIHGTTFAAYRANVPYFLPLPFRARNHEDPRGR